MPVKRTLEERFWAKVQKTDSCWLWTGAKNPNGYGVIGVNGRNVGAHRVAYELMVGPIPEGMQLDHLCRNHACVNWTHLEPVTPRENIMRGENHVAAMARQTHCHRGHPLSGDNLYVHNGMRSCKACWKIRYDPDAKREYDRARHARLKAERPPKPPKPAKTHCPQGHPLTPDNVGVSGKYRYCKQCNRDRANAYHARRKQEKGHTVSTPQDGHC